MVIKVFVRSVYGRDLIYPHCTKSREFAKIAQQETLTGHTINCIRALGYEIQTVSKPLPV